MSQVFYRVFRPQNFAEVVSQEAIKTTLKNAVSSGAVAHAYLFTGPRGVGKTSLARILAKALNCTKQKKGEPCGECDNCQAITRGNFLDLIEIDAASNTGVDNIREIIEHVKFAPSTGKYKVIVIDEAHMLSKGAFNALLKTLEEPPAHAVFVLATTEINKVPATIISRTQRFDFKRLSQDDIVKQMQKVAEASKVKAEEEVFKLVARAADGGMRDALSLLNQLSSFSGGKVTLEEAEGILGLTPFHESQDFVQFVIDKDLPASIGTVKRLASSGKDLLIFTNGVLDYLDMILGQKLGSVAKESELGIGKEDFIKLQTQAENLSLSEVARLMELFLTAFQKIKYSPLPELPLEIALIEAIEPAGSIAAPAAPVKQTAKQAVRKATLEEEKPEPVKEIVTEPKGSVEMINSKWSEFLNAVKEYNHSLISSLRLARLVGVTGQNIVLSFPYRFHKEAVEQRKNKIILDKALEEVYGDKFRLKFMMEHEVDDKALATDEEAVKKPGLLDEAMKVFGAAGE